MEKKSLNQIMSEAKIMLPLPSQVDGSTYSVRINDGTGKIVNVIFKKHQNGWIVISCDY